MIEMRHKDEIVGFYADETQARAAVQHMPFPMQDLTIGPTKRYEFRVNGSLALSFDDGTTAGGSGAGGAAGASGTIFLTFF